MTRISNIEKELKKANRYLDILKENFQLKYPKEEFPTYSFGCSLGVSLRKEFLPVAADGTFMTGVTFHTEPSMYDLSQLDQKKLEIVDAMREVDRVEDQIRENNKKDKIRKYLNRLHISFRELREMFSDELDLDDDYDYYD